MDKAPLVSIVMNCFNGQTYLKTALDSVLAQTYQNWELIFWDNQSVDKSVEIFKSYKDKRFKFFSSSKHTILYESRNNAIQKTNGDLIAFLDTDDYWLSEKLKKQVKLFEDDKVALVYGNFWMINEQSFFTKKIYSKKRLPTGNVLNAILLQYSVGLLTIIIRKKYLQNIKKVFNTQYDLLADYDFVINFSIKNKFECVQDPVACYRIHKKNTSLILINERISQLKLWHSSIQSHPILSSQKGMKKVSENIKYSDAMQTILEKNFYHGFCKVFKFSFGFKKIKLIIALILPKRIILKLKNLNY